jgi:Protein of unknown function (DUF2815)
MAALNTPYATLSFPNLFSPRPRAQGADPVYNCVLVFDPQAQKSAAYKALQDACIAVARKEFGENINLKSVLMPFKDAGEKQYDGYYPGHTYISPWSKQKPGIVNSQRVDVKLPEEVWAGQLVRANVVPFAWNNTGRKGVSFGLNHVQLIQSDGRRRLDGRPTAGSAFDDGEVKEEESIF